MFSKKRDPLLTSDIAAKFLSAVLAQAAGEKAPFHGPFLGGLNPIEAWASMKSFRAKDGSDEPPPEGGWCNREADFHGRKRSNETLGAECWRNWLDRASCGQLIGRSWIDSRHRHDLDLLRSAVRKAKRKPFFNSLLRSSFQFHR